MHKMGSCGTKVDTRPGMSENNANYYGVKMHHSEHCSVIQETLEKGTNQIQDRVKKKKESVIAKGGFTNCAVRIKATMTEYPGRVHLMNRLQREFNYLQPSDVKKVSV